MTDYQWKAARYYNSRVKYKLFKVGDLVLRWAEASRPTEVEKLSPKGKGPYRVSKIIRPGAYQLKRMDNSDVSQTWNSKNLQKYYQ